jgi:hypothetical protein
VVLGADRVRESVNHAMLAAGMAYPLFYETLFQELRTPLVDAARSARATQRGYIVHDQSATGVTYSGPHTLGELPPIFPKLFRRLDEYNGETLQSFVTWLDEVDNERVHTLSDDRFVGFQDVLEVTGDQVRMRYAPEDLVFRPKPFGPSPG